MKKIAILGAGPAGIEAAAMLAAHQCPVTLYEKNPQPLANITDKAFLFPNFASADEVAAALLAKLDNPLITLRCNTEVSQLVPSFIAGFQEENLAGSPVWKVNDELYDMVLLATGYTPFDAHRKEELGYGIYPGVHTSLEMEKMIREKNIVNTIGEKPKRIVFLQCVGSRDEKSGNHYCSKLCCVTAVKQAIEAKKLLPDCEVYLFYMDLRMWGQHFEEMYRTAQQDYDINFVRGRISEAGGTFDGRVQIKAEDTLLGRPLKMTSDLLVLMVGMEASQGTRQLSTMCHICGDYGFAQSADPHLHDCQTTARGLFVAGACKRPMTLNDSINDGRSAAYEIITSL